MEAKKPAYEVGTISLLPGGKGYCALHWGVIHYNITESAVFHLLHAAAAANSKSVKKETVQVWSLSADDALDDGIVSQV